MREFYKSETYWWKCYNCGCNNKVLTHLHSPNGELVGRTLKCCNCGYEFKMLRKPEDEIMGIEGRITPGEQWCIRLRGCPHKDCPLYNKRWKYPSGKDDDNTKPDSGQGCKPGCKCGCKDCRFFCNGYCNPTKLTININNSPKFL